MQLTTSILDNLPRLGWVKEPTPITLLDKTGKSLNASWLGCKRDDLCPALFGGMKVRKLDYLLASEPFNRAPSWTSIGAIGSGHLVACTAAAKALNRQFNPHLFWEPISDGIAENLAYTLSGSEKVHFYRSRLTLFLNKPSLFLRRKVNGNIVIPIGATCPASMLGLVRAGLELAEQIRNGDLPEPDRIYVAFGTGGTVAGLAIGLALGGLKTQIHAIAVVERVFTTKFHVNRLIRKLCKTMLNTGITGVGKIRPAKIDIDRSQLGKGYGIVTQASIGAVKTFRGEGITIDPVYTGKAAAAMLNDITKGFSGKILFWNTLGRSLPHSNEAWKKKLPNWVIERIN